MSSGISNIYTSLSISNELSFVSNAKLSLTTYIVGEAANITNMYMSIKEGYESADEVEEKQDNFNKEYKKPVSNKTGKEKADDIPSWAKGERPYINENGKQFAKRLLDKKYGENNYDIGPNSEFNKIKKWGDRGFE